MQSQTDTHQHQANAFLYATALAPDLYPQLPKSLQNQSAYMPAAPTSVPASAASASASGSGSHNNLPAPTPPMPMFSPSGFSSFSSDPKAHLISRIGVSPRYGTGPASPGSMGGYFSTPQGFSSNGTSAQDYFSLSPGGSSLQFTTSSITPSAQGISSPRYPPQNQFEAPTSGTIMTSVSTGLTPNVTTGLTPNGMAPLSRLPSFYSQYPFRQSPSDQHSFPPMTSPNHPFTQAAYARQMQAANLSLQQPPPTGSSQPPRSHPMSMSMPSPQGTKRVSESIDEMSFKRSKWEQTSSPGLNDFAYNPAAAAFAFSNAAWPQQPQHHQHQPHHEYEDHKSAQILYSLGNPFSNKSHPTPPPSSSPGLRGNPQMRANKGLRHFSKQVCDKVESKGVTTYNEVADELAVELTPHKQGGSTKVDQKNVRRRVYDALNVLMAIGIIGKEKKEIRWKGLQYAVTNDDPSALATIEATRRNAELTREVTLWRERTRRMWEQLTAAKQVVAVNKSKGDQAEPERQPNAQLRIPFMLLTSTDDDVKVNVNKDGEEAVAKANELHVIGWEEVARHKVQTAQIEAQVEALQGNNPAIVAAAAAAGMPINPASIAAMQVMQQSAMQQQAALMREASS